jgi:hypothetical protein
MWSKHGQIFIVQDWTYDRSQETCNAKPIGHLNCTPQKCFKDGQPSVDDDLQKGRELFIMKRLPCVIPKEA